MSRARSPTSSGVSERLPQKKCIELVYNRDDRVCCENLERLV